MRVAIGAVGAEIDIPLPAATDPLGWDLTGATITIVAARPSHGRVTWTAVAVALPDGTQVLRRTTAAGDLDEAGVWTLRPRVAWTDGRDLITTDPLYLEVRP